MKMRVKVAIAALMLIGLVLFGQSHPDRRTDSAPAASSASCGLNHSDLQDELKEMTVYTSTMQSRIVMLRNSAAVTQTLQLRNAFEIDAELWQGELDQLKKHMARMQAALDRCEAREKINENSK